ncbi:MAG TPA: maleylpyruvate isomerase N-terminal domain-containing protein [Micromonosporaceae bacterium]|jgi:Mycothiol maleylpyruvate isomerase N-terminal domain.
MIANAYLHAATSAATLVADPAVSAAWSAPSALAGMSVGGLAAHLTSQIVSAARALDAAPTDVARVTIIEHYGRATWFGASWDQETNTAIRAASESAAEEGPAAVAETASEALAMLSVRLPDEPIDRSVRMPTGPWSLALDDFLITRMMEIAVHSDDLAVSVRIPTPELPESVMVPVFDLLTRLSVRRHGHTAALRALSRAERAPATISAL